MKEQIYTIPVNEAYDLDCECPVCELEKKLEYDAIKYALGAAMMEPDFRVESNEKGYCNRHFSQMFAARNKLPLALVLETHLDEMRKKIEKLEKASSALEKEKTGLFKKSNADATIADITSVLEKVEKGCMVCDKVTGTVERYIDVILYMWVNDENFKTKFENSRGVCLKHFKMLCEGAPKSIKKDAGKFVSMLVKKEIKELNRMQDDIHRFTLKFDYRNRDMELGEAVNAPLRTIEKISGYITPYEDDEQS